MKRKISQRFYHPDFLKILLNHILLLAIIGKFDLKWPTALTQAFSVIGISSAPIEGIYAIECFSPNISREILIFAKLIIAAVFPAVLLALVVIFWLVVSAIFENFNFRIYCIVTYITIFSQWHTEISRYGFMMFSCKSINSEESRLIASPSVKCWSGMHLYLGIPLGVFILVIWGNFNFYYYNRSY